MRNALLAAGLVLLVIAGGCRNSRGERPPPGKERVVIVFDPTVLGPDTVRAERDLLAPLAEGIRSLPPETWVDLYFVERGRMNGVPELRDSLPFDPFRSAPTLHAERADSLARRVEGLAREAWLRAHNAPQVPASCILSTVRRAQPSISRGGATGPKGERVALVLISDLREVCSDFGPLNFETSVPDRLPALSASADLAPLSAIHVVTLDAVRGQHAAADDRVRTLWKELFAAWGARSAPDFTSGFPRELFP